MKTLRVPAEPRFVAAPGQPVIASANATRSPLHSAVQPMLTDTGQLLMFG
jgi:hypothetical protein